MLTVFCLEVEYVNILEMLNVENEYSSILPSNINEL